jgi:hypothetical protein
VSLGVAKDQRLSLNPSQISGACGRLMCCLRYEHDFYVQARKRFPKEGKILVTARGEEKVVANDIFREIVSLRNAEGESRLVPLTELRRELDRLAGTVVEDEPADAVVEPTSGGDEGMLEIESESDDVRITYTSTTGEMPVQPSLARAPDGASAVASDDDDQRARRRRGRRGGRRGKRGGERGSPPAGG